MKIKEIIDQNGKDFIAIYKCEHCNNTEENRGYDDRNFHENVISIMECKSCGKTSNDNYVPRNTKYPDYINNI